ncbi:MAG: hypothetical protein NUW00_04405 [Candidatus Kaiserbacteria bacterium]|nr:hypothetical protein [Candidatus Kaiserbacteria bacterium]
MKKKLIWAIACGLLASLAMPAFASDSPGTYIDAKAETALNQQTLKESSTTFVIAERAGKVKDVTATLATSKPGADDTYLVKRIDSGLTAPGLITASKDTGSSCAMPKFSVGLDLKTAPMTSASGQGTSTIGGGSSNFTT